jgi:hypothetical protein
MIVKCVRVPCAIGMKVGDYFTHGPHGWVRLHKKVARAMTCPQITIATNIWKRTSSAGLLADLEGSQFRTAIGKSMRSHPADEPGGWPTG